MTNTTNTPAMADLDLDKLEALARSFCADCVTIEMSMNPGDVLDLIALARRAAQPVAPSPQVAEGAADAEIAEWGRLTDLFTVIAAKHGINDIQVNGGTADELFPRVLAEFIVAVSRGAEPDYTFEHLAGRGLHELRADELPAYLASVAHNFGARSTEFTTAVQWVAAEIERKTNDERILAVKLNEARDAIAASRRTAADAEPVGEAGAMPGTSGFTMACFKAEQVPLGTKLYAAPVSAGAADNCDCCKDIREAEAIHGDGPDSAGQAGQVAKVINVEPGNAFLAPPGYTVNHVESAAAPAEPSDGEIYAEVSRRANPEGYSEAVKEALAIARQVGAAEGASKP